MNAALRIADGDGGNFDREIADVLVYRHELTDDERQRVINDFARQARGLPRPFGTVSS